MYQETELNRLQERNAEGSSNHEIRSLPASVFLRSASASLSADGSKGFILVVDDDPVVRTALSESVRWFGYVVMEADGGEEAQNLLE